MTLSAETLQLLFLVFAAATVILTTALELKVWKLERRVGELEGRD